MPHRLWASLGSAGEATPVVEVPMLFERRHRSGLRSDRLPRRRRSVLAVAAAVAGTTLSPVAAAAEDWSPPQRVVDPGYKVGEIGVEAAGRWAMIDHSRSPSRAPAEVAVRRSRGATGWEKGRAVGRGHDQDTDINAAGRSAVTWVYHSGVAVRFRPADGRWAAPVTFRSRGTDQEQYVLSDPQVELNDSGAAVVWWSVSTHPHEGLGARTWIRMAYRDAAGHWRGPSTLVRFERFWGDADASIDARGNVLFAYREGKRVVVRSRMVGNRWTAARTLARVDPDRLALGPLVQQTQDGATAVAHWQTTDNLVAVRRDRGRWARPLRLNDRPVRSYPESYYGQGNLVVDEAGRVTAAWVRGDRSIVSARWSGRAVSRVRIAEPPRNGRFTPSNLDLEGNRSGDVVLVWANDGPRPRALHSVYRPAGDDWGRPQRVADPLDLFYADAAVRANGAVDVVWEEVVERRGDTRSPAWHSRRPAP